MGYRVSGILKLPDGAPANNAEIEFISRKNFSPLVQELKSNIRCSAIGAYDVTLEYGEYAVIVYPGGTYPAALGTIILAADTVAGLDLPTLLQQAGWQPATPEYIQQITAWVAEANASASAAKVSETNSKASEIAAEADRSEVAVNTADVRVKHSDVAAKSAQVSIDASATQVAKSTAVSAADTATQKALAAAESEASALSSATRAEQAAQTVVGAIIDAGPYNATSGVLPTPSMSSGVKRSSIWKVTGGGAAGGIELGVGDSLVYTASDNSYYKIDNTESVSSVNGKKGVVVISSADVDSDASGTAQNLVIQHAAKSEAHPISGVSGLQASLDSKYSASNKPTAADVGADPVGSSVSAISDHEAKIGAHPASGISGLRDIIDAICPPIGCAEWDRLRASVRAGHVPADGQVLKRADHPDMWAAITAGKVPVATDSDWLADPNARGCFTDGDGSTTFRIPDQNGKYPGSVGALYVRGDGLKSAGTNGRIQGDVMRDMKGSISVNSNGIDGRWAGADDGSGVLAPRAKSGPILTLTGEHTVGKGGIDFDASRVVPTGDEFRPTSLTGCWVVKVVKSSKVAGL